MWEALEATALAQHLLGSFWTYPLASAGHIAGIALLFGGIAPLDLRLLGFWPRVEASALLATSRRVAMFGAGLAMATGVLLFAARASEYVAKPVFLLKLALIAAALANALLADRALRLGRAAVLRWHAGASLALWLAAILAGRMVAYV